MREGKLKENEMKQSRNEKKIETFKWKIKEENIKILYIQKKQL